MTAWFQCNLMTHREAFLEMMLCVLHRYSICILIVELIGITSVIPYAAINIVHTHPTGSAGLPVDDGFSTPDKR